jgi:hypothetical protein
VQSHALLEAFHTSVLLKQAPASFPIGELRQHVQKRLSGDDELVVDPGFFFALKQRWPKISRVETQLRRGRLLNETMQFHYDVVLHIDTEPQGPVSCDWHDWGSEKLTLPGVRQLLEQGKTERLGIRNVPNSRLHKEVRAVELINSAQPPETVGELKGLLTELSPGIDPEDLWALGEEQDYSVQITWSGFAPSGVCDVVFERNDGGKGGANQAGVFGEPTALKPIQHYTNNPLRGMAGNRLMADLRRYLKEKLPYYMAPASFVILDRLPLTASGKIDRRALLALGESAPARPESFAAPRTPQEKQLAEIWTQILGVEEVGIHDNIFEIGGDSLMIFRISNRANQLGIQLAPKQFFQYQTIAELAAAADADKSKRVEASAELRKKIGEMPAGEVEKLLREKRAARLVS